MHNKIKKVYTRMSIEVIPLEIKGGILAASKDPVVGDGSIIQSAGQQTETIDASTSFDFSWE